MCTHLYSLIFHYCTSHEPPHPTLAAINHTTHLCDGYNISPGRLTVLDYLINELGIDPVAREKSGISSVHAAVQAGRYKAVKVQLNYTLFGLFTFCQKQLSGHSIIFSHTCISFLWMFSSLFCGCLFFLFWTFIFFSSLFVDVCFSLLFFVYFSFAVAPRKARSQVYPG